MERPSIESQITFLYTRDLVATSHFYEEVLGLPLKLDQGACRIYQVGRDAYLGFCQRGDAPRSESEAGTRPVIVTLVTPEVDAWYEVLRRQGVEFEKAPAEHARFNIYHCFLRDPNGYLIEIQRFLHPF
jgi:catechol 2,3-dioxygenase-like lactoylglutathione lyase family enzyme